MKFRMRESDYSINQADDHALFVSKWMMRIVIEEATNWGRKRLVCETSWKSNYLFLSRWGL